MTIRAAIESEYDIYVNAKIINPEDPTHRESGVKYATQRALNRVALGTFSEELFEKLKSSNIDHRDVIANNYEGKIYFVDIIPHLSPEQLSQLISYFALTPIFFSSNPRRFIRIYDEEVKGFRIEELPTADSFQ